MRPRRSEDRRPISHLVDVPREAPRPVPRCQRCDRALDRAEVDEARDAGCSSREISDYLCRCVPSWAAEGAEG